MMKRIAAILIVGAYVLMNSLSVSHAARCVGATPCNACSTCSSCQYCAKNGGTCGVCAVSYEKPRESKPQSSGTVSSPFLWLAGLFGLLVVAAGTILVVAYKRKDKLPF
jgi:hypothetical protein